MHALHALARFDPSAYIDPLMTRIDEFVMWDHLGDYPTECFLPAMEDVLVKCGAVAVPPLVAYIRRHMSGPGTRQQDSTGSSAARILSDGGTYYL
jgi:hypothetical protein